MNALFECLRLWALDHLNALDDEVWEADEHGVLGSLRSILTGELGCTERADYDDEKWAVLVATGGEAAHREAHRMNGGNEKTASLTYRTCAPDLPLRHEHANP